jgi:hypothetical protein
MARWADNMSEIEAKVMHELYGQLISLKPNGWSVVQGDNELVMRPANRMLGKFSITISPKKSGFNYCLSFFSPSLNHWDGYEYFETSQDNELMLDWALNKIEVELERQNRRSV